MILNRLPPSVTLQFTRSNLDLLPLFVKQPSLCTAVA
jgi:hypothetical protein